MMAKGLTRGMTTALVLIMFTASALAGSSDSNYQRGHRDRHHDYIGDNGLPSIIQGVGTFAGSLSAMRVRGNGTYVYADGLRPSFATHDIAPKAKIITVGEDFKGALSAHDGCSYESGVCVIRGGQ
jgi:hypothetical protein